MADFFLGEIRIMPTSRLPTGWAWCDGQVLPIAQNTALFSILGNTYGGDGKINFALPDLRGRVPMQPGEGQNLSPHKLGETGGSEEIGLTEQQIPIHSHSVHPTPQPGEVSDPGKHTIARSTNGAVFETGDTSVYMSLNAIGFTGGNKPHNNLQPYLTTYFCIALQGVFPG